MNPINVTSEIGRLKKVLVHRPGDELLYLTPNTLEELLFDDIPDLSKAQAEHDRFTDIMREEGVEVVYLEDLMAETLDANPDLKDQFLDEFLDDAGIVTKTYHDILKQFFSQYKDNKELVMKTMAGVKFDELPEVETNFLIDELDRSSQLILNPMPNLYFTRDPFASVGDAAVVNKMYSVTRNRETIYCDYIFRYHPEYAGKVPNLYGRHEHFHIEGGDVFNVDENTLFVGISQRTEADALQKLAHNIYWEKGANNIKRIYAFDIPNNRAMMHLDTVFTMIDRDAFTYHPGITATLRVFELTKDENKEGEIVIKEMKGSLKEILENILGKEVRLFPCGAGDVIAAEREQWTDGSNTLTLEPGKILVYKRNYETNKSLKEAGFEVLELDSDNLTVGRGGPRCMSMPLVREPIEKLAK
ncbi:arginine deiminase [Kallipyga massiliensis]|uniref:arginine deiminase n=1 Tax=Kallipyga massiliensis TaxID=1472764 RepID=UPI0026F35D5B|nr:arginine deiminase [Kallipyga massiliensis]